MPRASEEKNRIEAERLKILHDHQAKARRRVQREVTVRKAGRARNHLPGEEALKKNMAVWIKLSSPKISYREIAARIGEPRSTVRDWFYNDAEVKELYEYASRHVIETGINYLDTLLFEAMETLATVMRYGSEAGMIKAAIEILDRRIPKKSHQEIDATSNHSHKWEDRNTLVEEIRQLPPDMQEAALEALESFEELLAKNSSSPLSESESDEEFEEDEVEDGTGE